MKIRIIGSGAMGSAIAQTLQEAGKEISVYDKHPEKSDALARAIGAPSSQSPLEGLDQGDGILLAVKPQDFEKVKTELQPFSGLMVSILTGISTQRLKEAFPQCTVLRMMPNLAVCYGDGIVALAEDEALAPFKARIEEIFSPLGMLRWIDESLFNAVTSLTGSGPAFVFTMVEAMVDAAIALGFSSDAGYELVKQMVGGALTLLYESPDSPAELRWKTCSPAGTTIAGIRALEAAGLRHAIMEAFIAAKKRAEEFQR